MILKFASLITKSIMITGPRYKKARRLGAGLFEKTATEKFSARQSSRAPAGSKGRRPASEFGKQLLEKQKARFSYGIGERQFRKYVHESLAKKSTHADADLFITLESRLDNVVYRLRLAKTRQAARQMVSHGHITVNEKKVTIPSCQVCTGDSIGIRAGSKDKKLFLGVDELHKEYTVPSWLAFDLAARAGKVQGLPKLVKSELMFDVAAILEYYRR